MRIRCPGGLAPLRCRRRTSRWDTAGRTAGAVGLSETSAQPHRRLRVAPELLKLNVSMWPIPILFHECNPYAKSPLRDRPGGHPLAGMAHSLRGESRNLIIQPRERILTCENPFDSA